MNPIIYAGPSLTPAAKALLQRYQFDIRPPVRRNDIDALNEAGFVGTIIMVDGRFKDVLAVGHAEIREALQRGCTIFGLASMGAIRAYEMEKMGMVGYGKVYEYFRSWDDFQDDEVALLHGEAPYYYAFSEPLVHFRECVKDLVETGKLKGDDGQAILQKLKSLYFGERTMELFLQLLSEHADLDISSITANFDQYRIKQSDLLRFLQNESWKSSVHSS